MPSHDSFHPAETSRVSGRRPRILFFARVAERAVLDRVEFYAQDLQLLAELGCEVEVAIRPEALRPADLYFTWWWTWAFAPAAMAFAMHRPHVITGVVDLRHFAARPRIHRVLMRGCLRTADCNLFVSRLEYAEIPARLKTRAPTLSLLAVDTRRYRPGPAPRDPYLLLTIGAMDAGNALRKGIPEFLDAVALLRTRLPAVRGIVAGHQGSDFPAIRARAEALGLTDAVSFPGIVSGEEKIRLLQRCGAYVQPSQFEGFGLAMLEAMSCGAPVVARPAGAVPEVVGETAQLVTEPGAASLASALEALLGDREAAGRLGLSARARAETVFPLARRRRELAGVLGPLLARRGLTLQGVEPDETMK